MTNLLKPVAISLDNYFVNRTDTPLDETGDYDYESLYALDLDLFNKDLNRLLQGETIEMPTYNFETGEREYRGNTLKLEQGSVLILEGIHGLNPDLTPQIETHLKYRIYVSALTTISIDDHNWIPTADNRLLRRIIRDHKYRGGIGTEHHSPLGKRETRRRKMDIPLSGKRRCHVQLFTPFRTGGNERLCTTHTQCRTP